MAAPQSDLPTEGITALSITPSIRNRLTWSMYKKVIETSKINPLVRPRLPAPHEPAIHPSDGDVAIFAKQVLVSGLRIPLPPHAQELCRFYEICPGQLTPVGWLVWSCFVMLCYQQEVPYSLELFRYNYKVVPAVGGNAKSVTPRDVFFTVRPRGGADMALIGRLPDSVKDWKASWIFVTDPGDFPRQWRSRALDDSKPPVGPSTKQLASFSDALRRRNVYQYKNIFRSNADLYEAGLFPQFDATFEPNWVRDSPFFLFRSPSVAD